MSDPLAETERFFSYFERTAALQHEWKQAFDTVARNVENNGGIEAFGADKIRGWGLAMHIRIPVLDLSGKQTDESWIHENPAYTNELPTEVRDDIVAMGEINKGLYGLGQSARAEFIGRKVALKALDESAISIVDRHIIVTGNGIVSPPLKPIKAVRGRISGLSLFNGDGGIHSNLHRHLDVDRLLPGQTRLVNVVRATRSDTERLVDVTFI